MAHFLLDHPVCLSKNSWLTDWLGDDAVPCRVMCWFSRAAVEGASVAAHGGIECRVALHTASARASRSSRWSSAASASGTNAAARRTHAPRPSSLSVPVNRRWSWNRWWWSAPVNATDSRTACSSNASPFPLPTVYSFIMKSYTENYEKSFYTSPLKSVLKSI